MLKILRNLSSRLAKWYLNFVATYVRKSKTFIYMSLLVSTNVTLLLLFYRMFRVFIKAGDSESRA